MWKEPNSEVCVIWVPRKRLLQIKFFWYVNDVSTSNYWLTFECIDPEHEGTTIFRNVGKYLAAETA